MEDLDLQDLSSNLSWDEDPVSPAQILDQTPEPEPPPPPPPPAPAPASALAPTPVPVPAPASRSSTMTLVSTKAGEPLMDLEADFPIGKISVAELIRVNKHNQSCL